MTLTTRRARLFFLGALPVAAASINLFACSDDARPDFDGPHASPDGAASLPETAPPVEDAGVVDARVPVDASDEAVVCTEKPCVTQLVSGGSHFCALLEDKTVRCWGGAFRALGIFDGGSDPAQPTPMPMGLTDVEQLSAANTTTCARHTNGKVTCWGSNYGNELGLSPPRSDYGPHGPELVSVDGGALDGVTRVDVGSTGIVFATKADGELWTWGDNSEFALGRMTEPADYLGPGRATDFAGERIRRAGGLTYRSSTANAFAINAEGKLLMWGASKLTVAYPGPVPMATPGLENVSSASMSGQNICAVADGELYCWGEYGAKMCLGTTDGAREPRHVRTNGHAPAQQVTITNYTCVRLTDGTIECCGSDGRGELGRGDFDAGADNPLGTTLLLTEAKAFTGHAVSVALANATTCALVQGGSVQCWGSNEYGELGQGTRDTERHPHPVTVKFD